MGTSTNCSAFCGALSTLRERQDEAEILGTTKPARRCGNRGAGTPPPAGLLPAAQEYQGSGPWAPRRRCAPRCAPGPVLVVPAARAGWPAALPSRRLHRQTTGKNAWRGGGFCRHGALCLSSCPSSPALAIIGRCGATSRPGP